MKVEKRGMWMNYVVKGRRNLAAFARSKSSLATRGRSTPGTTVSIFNVAPAFSSSARALPTLPLSCARFSFSSLSAPLLSFFLLFADPEYIHPFSSVPRVQRLRTCPPPHVQPFFLLPLEFNPCLSNRDSETKLLPRNIQIYFHYKFIIFLNCIHMETR